MPKLKFIFALVAAFVFSGCYETTLLTRVPISALVSDKGADVKSALALTDVTPQTHDEKAVTENVRIYSSMMLNLRTFRQGKAPTR